MVPEGGKSFPGRVGVADWQDRGALGSEEILTELKTDQNRERGDRQERSVYPVEVV